MGNNNSLEKVSVQEKLQVLQNKIHKNCIFHNQQSVVYCSLPSCRKSPYLCNQCLANNIHAHQEGLYRHDQFIKSMMDLIQLRKIDDTKILANSVTPNDKIHANTIKQQIKLKETAQFILKQTQSTIGQFIAKLQVAIDRTMRKANKIPKTLSDTYYRFYSNPNLFVNKLMTDEDQTFIMNLKQKLDISASQKRGYSEQQLLQHYKIEFDSIKANLREILNVSNGGYFIKRNNSNKGLGEPKVVFKKSLTLPQPPQKLFSGAYDILATTKKQIFKIEPFDRSRVPIHNQPVSRLVCEPQTGEFIGILNPNNILCWDGKKMEKIPLSVKISSVSLLKTKNHLYGLLGQNQGVFNIINMRENKSVFHYRCADTPIYFIQICQQNSNIYCAGKTGNIYIFKYQLKFGEYQFDYLGQLPSSLLPLGQLQCMKINNYDMYLMGPFRNIVLYDLMLGAQIIRTQYNKKCTEFTDAIIYNSTNNPAFKGEEVLITICQGEAVLYCWSFDRNKRSIKVDPIILPNRQNKLQQLPLNSISKYKHQIWVGRQGIKEISAFSLQI